MRLPFVGLDSCPRATTHVLLGGSLGSSFGPYSLSRRSTSPASSPDSGSRSSSVGWTILGWVLTWAGVELHMFQQGGRLGSRTWQPERDWRQIDDRHTPNRQAKPREAQLP